MNALRYDGHDLRLEDIPRPEPGPGEVLVQVQAAGICRTDIEIVTGGHGDYVAGRARVPITLGHEWSGRVEAVGEGVEHLKPGMLVTGETGIGCGQCELCRRGHYNLCPQVTETGIINRDGAMAEYHLHPAGFTYDIAGLPFDQAAVLEPATCGVYACRQGRVTPADRVLITGGGSIGQLAAQAARAFGAWQVVVTSHSRTKLELAEKLGADAALQSDDSLLQAARRVTQGEMFDVAIECSGSGSALGDCVQLVKPRGRIVLIGAAHRWPEAPPPGRIVGAELQIIGVRGSPHVWPETIELVRKGKIKTGPVISHRLPLAQWRQAFDLVQSNDPTVLKALLLP